MFLCFWLALGKPSKKEEIGLRPERSLDMKLGVRRYCKDGKGGHDMPHDAQRSHIGGNSPKVHRTPAAGY